MAEISVRVTLGKSAARPIVSEKDARLGGVLTHEQKLVLQNDMADAYDEMAKVVYQPDFGESKTREMAAYVRGKIDYIAALFANSEFLETTPETTT